MPKGIYKHYPHQGFQKGQKIKRSKKHRRKLCEARKKRIGEKAPNWKGGKNKNFDGYIYIYQPTHPYSGKFGYILEHRLVVEKQINRYLLPTETCHHLEAKDDNRPHMLMAFINNSAHKRFENKGKVKQSEIIFDGRQV